jgi:serine/threonine-protein kinase
MNTDSRLRYARAKPIALAALELESVRRSDYVEMACGSDEELRDEVCWMLHAVENTAELPLEFPLLSELEDISGSSVAGSRQSRYRLVRQLGEGGMGVVYLAERLLDEGGAGEIRQPVALKFINTGHLMQPGALRRFVEERRILATLNHPGIASLIDAGSTADGRPFLALEYVEGERIDEWCDRHRLSLRRRVVLFLKVCAAVRHAHERLVIHRDIKPANILVTADGEPKLLDFGIARLLDQVGGHAAAQTVTMQRALTLAYASPEQVRGEPLRTRADVWSLGVVLYQLVCGERPFSAGNTDSPLDLSNAIVGGPILPPSRRLRRDKPTADAQAREAPADIDAIVMKALRRDPLERYANVGELSADLQRFLDLRPVRARRGHRWYRAGLFLRRHRVGMVLAAVMLAMFLGFLFERESQLRRVEIERDKTQAIAGFMQDLFENADPTHAGGSHVTVRQVLDRGAATLASRTDIAPEVRVALLLSMARSYNQLSLGAPALTLLKEARRLQRTYDAGLLERGEVLAALGRAYSTVLDLPSAIVVNDEAAKLLAQASGDHAKAIERVDINQLYNHLGEQDMPLVEVRRQVRAILARLEADPGHDRELHVQALAVLAMTDAAMGNDQSAQRRATRALDEARALYVADDPTLVYYRFVQALVSMRADPGRAVIRFRQAIVDYDSEIVTPGPSLAVLLSYFGRALARMGHTTDAVSALERATRVAADYVDASPDFYFSTLNSLAAQYLELGRDADAQALLLPHLAQLQARRKTGSVRAIINLAQSLNVLASVSLHAGRADQAAWQFLSARELLGGREQQAASVTYADSLAGLGEAALKQGRISQADSWLQAVRGFNARSKISPESHRALDADLLQVRVEAARGHTLEAAGLAATSEAVADTRWGPCSRSAMDFRKLVVAGSGRTAATPMAEGRSCPMPNAATAH